MRKLTRRVPTVISLLALFFALGGTAIAAKHYLITSTHQIKPSVLKALKGKAGKTGPGGKAGEAGKPGETGKAGENGKNGLAGANGEPGRNGAVAGYSAEQSSDLNITTDTSLTALPGLSKSLPAGSFIVTASIEIVAAGGKEKAGAYASAECVLIDKTSGAGETQASGSWGSGLQVDFATAKAIGEIPLQLPVSTGAETSTLTVQCKEAGHGEVSTIEAERGSLVAVQTSENK